MLGRDVYFHRLRAGIAAMAAALDGIDRLVFTGSVGERFAEIRTSTLAGLGVLGFLGITEARTRVVAAREDLEIARQVHHLLCNTTNKENTDDLDVLRRIG